PAHLPRARVAVSRRFVLGRPARPEVYPLSLHDALPISSLMRKVALVEISTLSRRPASASPRISSDSPLEYTSAVSNRLTPASRQDRKSTRLNSSHVKISYAVFCLKKKTLTLIPYRQPPA